MTDVLIDNDGGVRIITLSRPDRLNALNASIMEALVDATADAARDTSVGCVVVTGAGRGFCPGGDIKDGGSAKAVVPANRRAAAVTSRVSRGCGSLWKRRACSMKWPSQRLP